MLKFKVREINTEDCKDTQITMVNIKSPVDNNSPVDVNLQFILTPQQKEDFIKSLMRDSYL